MCNLIHQHTTRLSAELINSPRDENGGQADLLLAPVNKQEGSFLHTDSRGCQIFIERLTRLFFPHFAYFTAEQREAE